MRQGNAATALPRVRRVQTSVPSFTRPTHCNASNAHIARLHAPPACGLSHLWVINVGYVHVGHILKSKTAPLADFVPREGIRCHTQVWPPRCSVPVKLPGCPAGPFRLRRAPTAAGRVSPGHQPRLTTRTRRAPCRRRREACTAWAVGRRARGRSRYVSPRAPRSPPFPSIFHLPFSLSSIYLFRGPDGPSITLNSRP